MLDRRPARVTGRQAPPLHLRRGSGSGAIFQRATHKFCGRGEINSIQIRYSKTINDSYVANTCMHCGAMQGYYYVVIDPHEIHHDLMHAYRMKKYIFKTLYPYDVRILLNDLQNIFINNQ